MTEGKKAVPGRNGGTLYPIQKGEARNPNGNPKGYKSFKVRLRELGMSKLEWKTLQGKKKKMTAAEALIMTLYANGIRGDAKAAKLVLEYAEDKKLEIETTQKDRREITPEMSEEEAFRIWKDGLAETES